MLDMVRGKIRNGSAATFAVGDTISGYTYGGVLVTGTVTALHDDAVSITGITVTDTTRGTWTVPLRNILTGVRR